MIPPLRGKAFALSLLLGGSLAPGEVTFDGDAETAWDLDTCQSRESYRPGSSCPPGTAAACWTWSEQRWVCWSAEQVPRWFASRAVGDAVCRSWPVEVAAPDQAHFYSGACTFFPSTAPPRMPELLSWEDAYEEARSLLEKLEREEKYLLMQGVGWDWPEDTDPGHGYWDLKKWYFVGNTLPIPRVGIPSLNMQDSSGGFRPYWEEMVGTVTGWPSSLALAATWDTRLVRLMALSLAQEVVQKGGNTILGPGVNVHRSAWGGRNFEYMCGEDPYLGSRLAENYVDAMQSQGVMAVVKHWVFNEQETFRDTSSSNVDRKTARELYYPPFKAAVDAGVVAAMCSYNKVDGKWSCQNSDSLHLLKDELGFEGFVQSDWWADHGTDLEAGLDQDMPGIADWGIGMTGNWSAVGEPQTRKTWFSPEELDKQPEDLIDGACLRILAAMSRVRVQSNVCTPPNCTEALSRNVTNAANVALARSIAAESIVLLQNRGEVLPLASPVKTVAVVGSAAVAEPYDPAGAGQGEGIWWKGDIYSGGGSGHIAMHAKDLVTPLDGITRAAKALGIGVVKATTNSTTSAVAAAKKADVTIVVGGAISGESQDRKSLHLEDGVDEQIAAVSKVAKKVVVIMQVPGAVVMPWRDDVDAILISFHPGQRAGSAWGDVLFGRHPPTGRLPVTLPETENDTIRIDPESQVVDYTEGMKTGYRSSMAAAFPFGHGLTYTTFRYGTPSTSGCPTKSAENGLCVTLPVTNAGYVAALTVPQLYLEFDSDAGYPSPILRGFQKTSIILPGGTQNVTFVLTPDDMSYWNEWSGSWTQGNNIKAHIGESSADIRQTIYLDQGLMSDGHSVSMWLQIILIIVAMVALVPAAWALCTRLRGVCWRPAEMEPLTETDGETSDTDEESKK